MVLFIFILSCMVTGSLACTDEHCQDFTVTTQLYETKFMPNRSQLEIICPNLIKMFECEKTYLECPGQSIEEVAVSSDTVKSKLAKAILGGLSLIRELCDNDSDLQKDYLESVECARSHITDIGRLCLPETSKPTEDYFNQFYSNEDDFFKKISHISCVKDAFHTACMVYKLRDTCGTVAEKTALYGLERMKDALKANRCANVENAENLKTKFLEFLNYDEQKKNSIKRVLDFFLRE
ncbi:uncharacterized protein LOC129984173 [Argiope bruennichi]|uniref:uncharacterized protein LOC129984173 n=1 Tax=Argiope bruennichi TaxID=94029 RepID=UPI002494DBFB|nr:uncharacterized protein LOC129984173 [Argiope bruennichi]